MGANFGDLDNDGWLDFYLGTDDPNHQTIVPNLMCHNDAGQGFTDVSFAGGFAHLQKGHGIAFGDIDNDGDEDLFHQIGGFYPGDKFANALFENPGSGNSWVTLQLRGTTSNYFGVGAHVEVTTVTSDSRRHIYRVVGSGGSFGGSSVNAEIGLGNADRIEGLVIRWPGGSEQRHHGLEVNKAYRIVQGQAKPAYIQLSATPLVGEPGNDVDRHTHSGH